MANHKQDNFLADAVRPRTRHMGYFDGFRFGFGFFISGLLVALLVGAVGWGLVLLFQPH